MAVRLEGIVLLVLGVVIIFAVATTDAGKSLTSVYLFLF